MLHTHVPHPEEERNRMTDLRVTVKEPSDVGEARAAIERSRERISETLGAIEDRLVETKESIRERVNVLRPVQDQVRTRPWVAVAVAAGVGAALGGVLGGSDDDEDAEPRSRGRHSGDEARSKRHGRKPHREDVRAAADRHEGRDRDDRYGRDHDVLDADERRRRRAYRARRRERLEADEFRSEASGGRIGREDRDARRDRGDDRGSASSVRSEIMRAITGAITSGLRDRLR
jgi:ElaB/YqjD/DUF883 family membrane-anchored ribosome-binding protein